MADFKPLIIDDDEIQRLKDELNKRFVAAWNRSTLKAEPACECGSYKAMGIGRGMAGHSDWCPWSKP